ncbi:hypothetical protein BWP39_11270 [Paraburkholderia acidicola]|uniref:Uncharacterized protein n=1 Tax=Paraburkholderia acidicola TaxID=1912599 RepID=A0A2A4EXH4_9BURK|nr:hypothetical protein BWP39_11270 [Paraburkholderia acidicola]
MTNNVSTRSGHVRPLRRPCKAGAGGRRRTETLMAVRFTIRARSFVHSAAARAMMQCGGSRVSCMSFPRKSRAF